MAEKLKMLMDIFGKVTIVAAKMIVNAFCKNPFAFSQRSCTTLFADGSL